MSHSIKTGISLDIEFSMGQVNHILYLYGSLNAEDLCGEWSGFGVRKRYSRKDIENAMSKLKYMHSSRDLSDFKDKFNVELEYLSEDKATVLKSGLTIVDCAPQNRSIAHKEVYLFLNDLLSKKFETVDVFFG